MYWLAVSAATTTRASCHDRLGAVETRLGGIACRRGCRRRRRAPSSPAGRRCSLVADRQRSGPGGRGWRWRWRRAEAAAPRRWRCGARASAIRAPALAIDRARRLRRADEPGAAERIVELRPPAGAARPATSPSCGNGAAATPTLRRRLDRRGAPVAGTARPSAKAHSGAARRVARFMGAKSTASSPRPRAGRAHWTAPRRSRRATRSSSALPAAGMGDEEAQHLARRVRAVRDR